MIYFSSDLHFGREVFFTEKYTERHKLWGNVDEMNEQLIKNWNETVSNDDVVFILGDFSNIEDRNKNTQIWNRLKGKKKLVLGNNDNEMYLDPLCFKPGLVVLPSCITITTPSAELFLSHYPTLDWKNKFKWVDGEKTPYSIHLYGHVHHKQMEALEGMRAYNVCVDQNDFKPVSLESILKLLNLTC